jgi:hypothetical protein
MATPTSLPAAVATGDVGTAAQFNGLRGAFRIMQVASTSTTTIVSVASTSYTEVFRLTITPQSTSSKVLVMSNSSIAKTGGNASNGVNLVLKRNGVAIASQVAQLFTGTAIVNIGTSPITILDSPNSAAVVTYTLEMANFVNASAVEHSANNSFSSFTLMEVSA